MTAGRILIVDDDPHIRDVLGEILEEEGHSVVRAAHGAEALQVSQTHPVDLIFLDMRMPVMDGWQFAQAYRQLPEPRAPIVVMTAARDAAAWCAEIDGDGCLPKPFELDAVLSHLDLIRS